MPSLRLILRSLWRSPGFTISAVLCIAIAIALSTSMAAILDAVKHPYVPVKEPERLASIAHFGGGSRQITQPDWRAALGSASFVEAVTFTAFGRVPVESGNFMDDRIVSFVTPDFFPLLGVKPVTGRYVSASAENDAVVISDDFRRAVFPNRKKAIGSPLYANGRSYTVVGVAPAGMGFVDLWVPFPPSEGKEWAPRYHPLIRLKKGVTPPAVDAELKAIGKRLDESYGGGTRPIGLRLDTFRPDPQNFRRFHAALAAAGLIVLLVAGGNVASLLLARSLERRPEHVLRIALGATPSIVARNAIAESVLLAIAGCALGVLLAVWCMNVVSAYRPTNLSWLGILDPHLSWRVFAYALVTSLVTAIAAAIVPVIRIARVDPGEVLKAGAGTMTRIARRRDTLVIAQLALSLTLLFCAGILTKSAMHVKRYDFGYDPQPLAKAEIFFFNDSLNKDSTFRDLVQQASRLPGVQGATFVGSAGAERGIVTADEHTDSVGVMIKRSATVVDPAFFRTVNLSVIAGRDFQYGDEEEGAAIVDQEAARKLWRGDSVVGRYLKLGDPQSKAPWIRVVGVVKRMRLGMPSDPDLPPEPGVFVVQKTLSRSGEILIRSANPPMAANALRQMLRERLRLRGRVYYSRVSTWTADRESTLSARWFMAALFGVFAGFTLLLSLAGIYGTLSYSVSRRMREFGVRTALGATDTQLRKLVLAQAAIAILAATAIGGPGGILTARLLVDSWLYDVWYSDVTVLLAAEAILILTAFVVCIPAMRRASKLEPSALLREL